MKNNIQHPIVCKLQYVFVCLALLLISLNIKAQIPPNAINADPSAKSVTREPLGSTIVGNAVLKFKFTNEATSSNNTGQIPVGSVRLTLSFPGAFAYTSVNSIPKFEVEDADTDPFGVVHLVNNALILEGEIIDLLVNVRSISNSAGFVTFNVDRTSPVIVANLLTSNDNAQTEFTAFVILPVNLTDFAAQKQNCSAKISWITSNETNILNYVLEVSNDKGANYKPIETIAANNSAAQRIYNTNHTMSNNNAYLYRLRINDISGSYTYSPVARIGSGCGKAGNEVLVYPSPAMNNVTLNVSDANIMNTKAQVIDVAGKTHMTFAITSNTKNINVSKLPPGMYVIRLQDGSSAKFMKQ